MGAARRRLAAALADDADRATLVDLVYRHCLGREVDPVRLRHFTAQLRKGVPISRVLQEIEASSEAQQGRENLKRDLERRETLQRDLALSVEVIFQHYCGRAADPEALRFYTEALRTGTPFSQILQDVERSPEAQQRRRGVVGDFDEISDGEFSLILAELLFEHGSATPKKIDHWRKFLAGDRAKRIELVRILINAYIGGLRREAAELWDPQRCGVLGTERFLTTAVWQEKREELQLAEAEERSASPVRARRPFKHSGNYIVTAIASLYKGQRFIENFLDNITSQTIFDCCELIIIDANSPEREEEIIADYQETYPNIIYKRINYQIGVYDAWNIAARLARGRYLTNTNVDDLRRRDSFHIQASALDRNPSADVIYQDFFYSLDPFLNFDEVARLGFKSELPIITPNNLLAFNSPHNGPMWRKALHEDVGLFDTSYKSAGDWEFWLRCIWKGKNFLKVNIPHVVYYQNPDGLSTRPDTRGLDESRRILRLYSRRLISNRLLLSSQGFADLLGISPDWDQSWSYYDVVQRELRRLGECDRLALTDHCHST